MGLKDCNIHLDNGDGVYHPGDTITGRVLFVFDTIKKVRGIYVVFKGGAATRWVEERANKPRVTAACCGSEDYFTHCYYLLGDAIAFKSHKYEIDAGTHEYPLRCPLPATLPSSFEGEFGHVRYTITVTLDRPWKFDQEMKMPFTVVDHYDLNLLDQCKVPINIHMEEIFCCYWCRSAPLSVDVSIPRAGYCSGQDIPLEIACNNNSDVDVNAITVMFRQVTKYAAQTPVHQIKIQRKEIGQIQLEGVARKTSKRWSQHMHVPPIPPTSLNNCDIIDVHYDIKVKCLHSGIHPDIKAKTTIIIGTVPLVGGTTPLAAPSTTSPLHPTAGCVEYQEGLYRVSSILEPFDNPLMLVQINQFAPKYPYYRHTQHPV